MPSTKCGYCGVEFVFQWPAVWQKHCSVKCTQAAYRDRHRDKLRKSLRKWVKNNRLRRLEIQRKWNNSESGIKYKEQWRKDHAKERNAEFREFYAKSEYARKINRSREISREELVASGRPKICARCGTKGPVRIECHHKDWNPLNRELANLEWLCSTCHRFIHSEHGQLERPAPKKRARNTRDFRSRRRAAP